MEIQTEQHCFVNCRPFFCNNVPFLMVMSLYKLIILFSVFHLQKEKSRKMDQFSLSLSLSLLLEQVSVKSHFKPIVCVKERVRERGLCVFICLLFNVYVQTTWHCFILFLIFTSSPPPSHRRLLKSVSAKIYIRCQK